MSKILSSLFLLFVLAVTAMQAQVEHVPVANPVYNFLIHCETKGYLPGFSSSILPLQKKEICEALKQIRHKSDKLNQSEISTLEMFEKEFEIVPKENCVLFYSSSDSLQVLSKNLFSNKEKFIYRNVFDHGNVEFAPVASLEYHFSKSDPDNSVELGNLGFRLHGTLDSILGYYLQATNGIIISGDKAVAELDPKLHQNVKFTDLNSDFDFTESHVRFDYKWFYCMVGRETRLEGSGINQRLILSSNAPAADGVSLGVRFSDFEYRFSHYGLLEYYKDSLRTSVNAAIPPKYLVNHRMAYKPSWGEIALWENIIYSKRNIDLAYINPLSFLKSLEHALRDRDNAMIGADFTARPINGIELKGTYILDDIIFSKIGTGYWSNKTALNIGITADLPWSSDIGFEYARVEPYTFTHFDVNNSYTNDDLLLGTYLNPNSDEFSLIYNQWYGSRYPLIFKLQYQRHGENIYDSHGNLIRNVGGNYMEGIRTGDSGTVTFLDGNLEKIVSLSCETGWEIIRNFNFYVYLKAFKKNDDWNLYGKLMFRFLEF